MRKVQISGCGTGCSLRSFVHACQSPLGFSILDVTDGEFASSVCENYLIDFRKGRLGHFVCARNPALSNQRSKER